MRRTIPSLNIPCWHISGLKRSAWLCQGTHVAQIRRTQVGPHSQVSVSFLVATRTAGTSLSLEVCLERSGAKSWPLPWHGCHWILLPCHWILLLLGISLLVLHTLELLLHGGLIQAHFSFSNFLLDFDFLLDNSLIFASEHFIFYFGMWFKLSESLTDNCKSSE